MLKQSVEHLLRSFGYELQRTAQQRAVEVPPLLENPLAALHLARGYASVAFKCPVTMTCDTQGFSLAADGWHPLVASISDQERDLGWEYEHSVLQRYFTVFQPQTALEAIPGFEAVDHCELAFLPAHLFHLTPWYPGSAERLDEIMRKWTADDAREHGLVHFDFNRHGVPYFGPASKEVGEMEIRRLKAIWEAIQSRGFDREHGDCSTYLVRRGDDIRAVAFGSGRHRAVTLAALGHEFIPAQFQPPMAVDVRDVAEWPQVQSGVWSQKDALRYVDHLFDFDALAWARQRQLA